MSKNTTESRHTLEPWYYESDGDGSALSHRDKYVCGDNGAGRILTLNDPSGTSNAEVRANGKRLCVCVNACAGMADPAAEIAALREALISMVDLREVHEGVMSGRKAVIDALGMARKALANIEHNHA